MNMWSYEQWSFPDWTFSSISLDYPRIIWPETSTDELVFTDELISTDVDDFASLAFVTTADFPFVPGQLICGHKLLNGEVWKNIQN